MSKIWWWNAASACLHTIVWFLKYKSNGKNTSERHPASSHCSHTWPTDLDQWLTNANTPCNNKKTHQNSEWRKSTMKSTNRPDHFLKKKILKASAKSVKFNSWYIIYFNFFLHFIFLSVNVNFANIIQTAARIFRFNLWRDLKSNFNILNSSGSRLIPGILANILI